MGLSRPALEIPALAIYCLGQEFQMLKTNKLISQSILGQLAWFNTYWKAETLTIPVQYRGVKQMG